LLRLLVLQRGSFERAAEVGALVGGVMFASTAVALCVVLRRGRSESTALHT
jgi:hypothetical protein